MPHETKRKGTLSFWPRVTRLGMSVRKVKLLPRKYESTYRTTSPLPGRMMMELACKDLSDHEAECLRHFEV